MKKYLIVNFCILLVLFSCTIEPKEIVYGTDSCAYCSMTIMDKSFAAQYVTKKGKPYLFDASECMLHKVNEEDNEADLEYLLVANYTNPGQLIDAKTATFLVSENIKSPMGGNLSAFDSVEKAENVMQDKGGQLFTWDEMKIKYSKK